MTEWLWSAGMALWLGVLTSISPCPLATNIAAISFLGRRVERTRRVLLGGLMYTAGRTLTYVALGVVVVAGLLAAPGLSHFLQKSINQILGPVLVLAGMFVLGLLRVSWPWSGDVGRGMKERVERGEFGAMGSALALGVVFALSFCPLSAALFFGSLIPLSVKSGSSVAMPLLYGLGTALPVVVFAVLVALGARKVGEAFNRVSQFEKYARGATGVLFIALGIYFIFVYIFGVFA